MKSNAQYYEFTVSTSKTMCNRTREMEYSALADESAIVVVTLKHPTVGKVATFNLLKEGDKVKVLLFDKVIYDRLEVYTLVKIALELH